MKFNLMELDYTKELSEQLKKQHSKNVEEMIKNSTYDYDEDKKITVFHGTTLKCLNSILLHGILPRDTTGRSNFEKKIESNKNLVYLTNKWHYFYAYKAFLMSLEKNTVDERMGKGERIKVDDLNIPCYVECEVSSKECLMDEDFLHSNYVLQRIKSAIKNRKETLEITYSECLAMYATMAHIGAVPRKDIKSFTILGNIKLLYRNFIDSKSEYQKQLIKWGKGKGKGNLKLEDLFELEDDELNATFWIDDIPENHIITGIEPTENKNVKYRLRFAEVKTEEI